MAMCNRIQDSLLDFPEHLSEQEVKEIQAHLPVCPSCRKELQNIQLLRGLLQAGQPEVPGTLRVSLMKQFGESSYKKAPVSVKKRRAGWLYAAASALLVISLTLFFLTRSSVPLPSVSQSAVHHDWRIGIVASDSFGMVRCDRNDDRTGVKIQISEDEYAVRSTYSFLPEESSEKKVWSVVIFLPNNAKEGMTAQSN